MIAALARPEMLLLFFVLIFSTLAFGTVEPWSLAIVEISAIAGLAIALKRRTRNGRLLLHSIPGTLPLLLFLGFLLLQCFPLPPSLLRLLSPTTHARWDAALGSAGPLPWLPLSLDPLATLREFFRFGACAAIYALTVQLLARRERLQAMTIVLPVFAAALSFEAILQFLIAPLKLLFIRASPGGVPFGPFVNRNHYANLMAMLTPVVFGLFLGRGLRTGSRTLRGRLVDVLAHRESTFRILLGFAAVLSAGSLVVSLSRGATVAVSAALLVFGCCLIAKGLGRRRAVAVVLISYTFAVFVGWFGWEKIADRFASMGANLDSLDAVRVGFFRDTLLMALDFPLFGAGVGSFGHLYPGYRTVAGTFSLAHAHNDHLELLAGGGLAGFCLFAWFVGAVLLSVARACSRRTDPRALYLAFGSVAGCVAFIVHGGSDFSLAIGANAICFFFLLGLAVSSSHSPLPQDESGTLLGRWHPPAALSHLATALALITALAWGFDFAARHSWSLAAAQERQSGDPRAPSADVGRLVGLAARYQPLDSAYPAALARVAWQEGNTTVALALTRRALRLLPVDAAALMQLGTILAALGEDEPARRSFTEAVAADPRVALNRERFGAWLIARGDPVAGLAQIREALSLDPTRAPGIFGMLVLAGFGDERIAAIIPPTPRVLLSFARYAATTGSLRLAGETYGRVLAVDPGNPQAVAGLRRLGGAR